MRNFLRTSLVAAVGLAVFVQAEEHIIGDAHGKRGLSDILGALGLDGGRHSKGEKGESTRTIKWQGAAAAKGNATRAAEKTVTVTKTEQAVVAGVGAVGSTGNVQLSFVTTTVFATGAPPTVTVTPLPQMITQMTTVTLNAAAPGINPPSGAAAGTGGIGGAGINGANSKSEAGKSSIAPAAAASSAANPAAAPAVGSPGSIANGIGSINSAGSCDCSCLCEAGSFAMNGAAAANPASIAPTTLQTANSVSPASSAAISSEASSAAVSSTLSSPVDNSTAVAQSAVTSSSVTAEAESAATTSAVSSPSSASASTPSSLASSLQLSLASTATGIKATAAAAIAPPTDPINISTFKLSSSLILGNLATATIKI